MKSYFNERSFQFLHEIKLNNNRQFFKENQEIYREDIIEPLKELISNLQMFIFFIDNNLETKPVINRAISTIYRDTRFSKKKAPFKNFIGFNFRRKDPNWKFYPAFIFRMNDCGYKFGLAILRNNPEYFFKFRKDINENNSFNLAISDIRKDEEFIVIGDNYKKYIYKGKNKEIEKYYSKKNIFITCERDKDFYKSEKQMILDITEKFEKLMKLYKYFNNIFTDDKRII